MMHDLTYHTFNLKKKRVRDAKNELDKAQIDLSNAEHKIRELGLNPHNFTQPEFDAARKRKREGDT